MDGQTFVFVPRIHPPSSAPAAPFIWEIKETSDHSQGIRDTKIYTLCLKKKSRKNI